MNVEVVSASAGTGKTTRLAKDLLAALADGTARPEGVVAITYTKKAAGELESRIRSALLEKGMPDLAARVRDGYIGTVHAVCQRLLREFALEVGLSPWLEPIPESQRRRLFEEALSNVLAGRHAAIAPLARRLAIDDWTTLVRNIVDAASENGLGSAELARSRDESVRTLATLLPLVAIGRDEYRKKFADEIAAVEKRLNALAAEDGTKAARGRARIAAQLQAAVRRQGLPSWSDQVAVLKEFAVAKLRPAVGKLLDLVNGHLGCEELHADLRDFTVALFDVAADALDAFGAAKRTARVVDFGDMLAQAVAVLRQPEVARALSTKLDLVLVDEFQDTSPMQLAVVMGLGALAKRSIWVGDRKQAIFSFQGSDPELMGAAMAHAMAGRPLDVLGVSHRSRPALVDLTSEVFARVLAPHGFAEKEVRLTTDPSHPDPEALAAEPVVELWAWPPEKRVDDGKTVSAKEPVAVAAGVEALLASGMVVRERRTPDGRQPLHAISRRDVAVLARRNEDCRKIAAALRDCGIPALVALGDLMTTPEARLARSALALVADPSDGIAAMDVSYLGGGAGGDPDRWLGERLEAVRAWRVRREEADAKGEPPPPAPVPFEGDPRVAALRTLREAARQLSPTEALDEAIRTVDLIALCRTWPEPAQLLANLEALRAEARAYEELCRVRRSACTASGLVEHLDGLRDEKDSNRQAIASDEDAVTVSTWHTAKGLEWPVVVLATLDDVRPPDPFGVSVEAAPAFAPGEPLKDRWIRFWPWPYGKKEKPALGPMADASPEGARVARRDVCERLRLLYVGFTRARDLLVLEAQVHPANGAKSAVLNAAVDAAEQRVLTLPFGAEAGLAEIALGDKRWPCRVRRLSGLPAPAVAREEPARRWYDAGPQVQRPREILNPSSEAPRPVKARIVGVIPLAGRVALKVAASDMGPLGDAVHGFLAADPSGDPAARRNIAERLLAAHGVAGTLTPDDLLRFADALATYLDARFPGAVWRREWPLRARLADRGYPRLLRGEVDLFLELPDGFVLVDHKSFPGGKAERDARLVEYAGQLGWYARALEAALGKRLRAAFIHLPIRGEIVEVDLALLLATIAA